MIKGMRVLNFDDSVVYQKSLMDQASAVVVDFKALSKKARFWCSSDTEDSIRLGISAAHRGTVTFLGSREYHHVTRILLKQYVQPLTMIVFDDQVDSNPLWPQKGCYGWVKSCFDQINVMSVIVIGITNSKRRVIPSFPGYQRLVKQGRLSAYGYYVAPLLETISSSIPTEDVYISIDKGCLKAKDHRGSFVPGLMGIDDVLEACRVIANQHRIVGMDVCGDYSLPLFDHPLKRLANAFLSGQSKVKLGMPVAKIDEHNLATNLKLGCVGFADPVAVSPVLSAKLPAMGQWQLPLADQGQVAGGKSF